VINNSNTNQLSGKMNPQDAGDRMDIDLLGSHSTDTDSESNNEGASSAEDDTQASEGIRPLVATLNFDIF